MKALILGMIVLGLLVVPSGFADHTIRLLDSLPQEGLIWEWDYTGPRWASWVAASTEPSSAYFAAGPIVKYGRSFNILFLGVNLDSGRKQLPANFLFIEPFSSISILKEKRGEKDIVKLAVKIDQILGINPRLDLEESEKRWTLSGWADILYRLSGLTVGARITNQVDSEEITIGLGPRVDFHFTDKTKLRCHYGVELKEKYAKVLWFEIWHDF